MSDMSRMQEIVARHRNEFDVSDKIRPASNNTESFDNNPNVQSANEAYMATENQKNTSGLADTLPGIFEGNLGPNTDIQSVASSLKQAVDGLKLGISGKEGGSAICELPAQSKDKAEAAAGRQ